METREQFDADRFGGREHASAFRTEGKAFQAICESCGKTWYVSQGWSEAINRAVENGAENPFLCDDCNEQDEEMAVAQSS